MTAVVAAALLFADAVRLVRHPSPLPPEPLHWALGLGGLLLGVRMVAYAVTNVVGWLFLALGVVATAMVTSAGWTGHPILLWLQDWLWWPLLPLLALLALVFPTGQPVGPRWRPVMYAVVGGGVVSTVAWAVVTAYSPMATSDQATTDAGTAPTIGLVAFGAGAAVVLAGALLSVASLTLRARRARGQQGRVVTLALAAAALVFAAVLVDAVWGTPWLSLAIGLPLPAAATIAVTRYGLYDIDLLVHRSLLYGTLTLATVGVYTVAVGATSIIVPQVATIAVVPLLLVALLPLHRMIQGGVDRYVYGARHAPHMVITQLGEQLEGRMGPERILPAVVSTIAEALKIGYAAIRWSPDGPAVAEHGTSRNRPQIELPLLFRGEEVGHLVVEARSPEEAFSKTERQALTDLARQAAAAAHAVRLIERLQQAREQLVTSREEERRRLRRDLHDGVGPALAGMTMQVGAARTLLAAGRAGQAADLIGAVEGQLVECAGEVRRAIRDLRPPTLDEYGLIAALRHEVGRFDRSVAGGMRIDINAPDNISAQLPAAVEVAALRIAVEAVTNATRHAAADRCVVTLRRGADAVEVEVVDNGHGITVGARTGVGLHSMRERAAELGGRCTIFSTPGDGTRVHAVLPIPPATVPDVRARAAAVHQPVQVRPLGSPANPLSTAPERSR